MFDLKFYGTCFEEGKKLFPWIILECDMNLSVDSGNHTWHMVLVKKYGIPLKKSKSQLDLRINNDNFPESF
jgi:hypothetical protein